MPVCIDGLGYSPTFVKEFTQPESLPTKARDWDIGLTWGRTSPQNGELQFYVSPDDPGPGGAKLGINPFSIRNGR